MPRLDERISSQNFLMKLNLNKIFSINEFLLADVEKLASIGDCSIKEILSLKQSFANEFSGSIKNGLELRDLCSGETGIIRTNIKGLDELLEGGLRIGTLTELCGLSCSGKTQLAVNILANAAPSTETFFIDTKRDFSASHFASLLVEHISEPEVLEKILDSVTVQRTKDIYNLISVLHDWKNHFANSKNMNKKLLVIDSISVPCFNFIGQSTNEGLSILNHLATILKYLSQEYNTAVLVTNLGASKYETRGWSETKSGTEEGDDNEAAVDPTESFDLKPFLGKYWIHVPTTRLIVSKPDKNDSRLYIYVKKSNMLKVGNSCFVTICSNGMIK